MREKKSFFRYFLLMILALMSIFVSQTAAQQQQDEDVATREITSLDFQNQRPKSASARMEANNAPKGASGSKQEKNISTSNAAANANSKRRYALVKRISPRKNVSSSTVAQINKSNSGAQRPKQNGKGGGPKKSDKPVFKFEEIGVTFWRLRPLAAADGLSAQTLPVKINNKIENWTAERVSSTTQFRRGDRVRFTVESPRAGFLYVVNREIYTDGTTGEASIIFPTLRTRAGGDNAVTAGSLIDVPGAEVSFPYFNVNPKRADYAGEELLVIISPTKLPFEIGVKALAVSREQVEKWFSDWETIVDVYDAEDGEGIAYTKTESSAAGAQSRALTAEEPLPQTIYRVRSDAERALLVSLRMQAQ